MTALFQDTHHASESKFSRPFRCGAEVGLDDSNADSNGTDGTCDAKYSTEEDASPILSPTLRQLPSPKPSLGAHRNPHRETDSEGEPRGSRSKIPQAAEMLVGESDEVGATQENSNTNGLSDFSKSAPVKKGARKTGMEEGGNNRLQTSSTGKQAYGRTLKLSHSQLLELTTTPTSLPLAALSPSSSASPDPGSSQAIRNRKDPLQFCSRVQRRELSGESRFSDGIEVPLRDIESSEASSSSSSTKLFDPVSKPTLIPRAMPTPDSSSSYTGSKSMEKSSGGSTSRLRQSQPDQLDEDNPPLHSHGAGSDIKSPMQESCPSPMPSSIPLPPLSLPTYLHLELSSNKPSPLYIHRSKNSELPYEPSSVKIERLLNFLLIPPQVEQVLWFGTLACLDAFLFSFTILPLRFFKALFILARSWGHNVVKEVQYIGVFIYSGTGRMWKRKRRESMNKDTSGSLKKGNPHNLNNEPTSTDSPFPSSVGSEKSSTYHSQPELNNIQSKINEGARRRFKSTPSALLPDQKADILKGFLLLLSCTILMYFDASRMYHGIRGQAAIKLYVIYNVLEVCDRLFAALGQDVLECLFAKETLDRHPNGRSKIWRPLWLFVLALIYNLVHATSLFYQVITLNVAVNSYSNALLTLLMSNQFVEIKSTVFKKFEKENLFQLTCADAVERFQLWLMLTIIAFRNVIETGGFNLNLGGGSGITSGSESSLFTPLRSSSSILPKSFTVLPKWTGQVMGPFLLVLGSEMLVDWIKHAYITKFNNTKPAIYGRFLDILAKDYYSNAFADQNLVRRLGLPVIPLASLFIRASVQTYHMFIATHLPLPLPSPSTSLSVDSTITSSPATKAAIQHVDHLFRQALGRSPSSSSFPYTTLDDAIASATMLLYFLVLFLVLLTCKLLLGMCLLSYARHRYRGMKERETVSTQTEGRRVGGWGIVEVDDDKRRWIYRDDPDGLKRMKEREGGIVPKDKEKQTGGQGSDGLEGVMRYSMVAKRIW